MKVSLSKSRLYLIGWGLSGVLRGRYAEEMFKLVLPRGSTPTGQRLAHILRQYLKDYEARVRETGDETCLKPLIIIVITDGAPSDEVGGVIKHAARRLDKLDAPSYPSYQIGFQFF
ncbi:von willebrand factor domain-containing protein [Seiridium cupressi]